MPDLKDIFLEFIRLLPVIFLSALGGAVSYLNKPREEFSWVYLCISLLTAGFAGYVMHCLLLSTSFSAGLQSAAIAISGYASRDVLLLVKTRLMKRIKRAGL